MRSILLIIGGGIAAYKCLDLVRRLGERGFKVRTVMTKGAQQFITPLSVSALTNERVFTDLFDLDDEREIGHIRLSRDAVVVAPATANLLAKMANGHADDLASAVLMACNKPVLAVPAMNPHMWSHPATRRNVAQLRADGIRILEPATGEMAERGEAGQGRLREVPDIVDAIEQLLSSKGSAGRPASSTLGKSLVGRHVLVTSGPTHEPIDPVRYIANRSSGKQGHAIAAAAAAAGARVTLISGPVSIAAPAGVTTVPVETAAEMLGAVESALPADIAIFAAAVADWRVKAAYDAKLKKTKSDAPTLRLVENPDILKTIGSRKKARPNLVVGFAAETDAVVKHAKEKLKKKKADLIIANDVSTGTGVMGGERNTVHLIDKTGVESWPKLPKDDVARRLIAHLAGRLASGPKYGRTDGGGKVGKKPKEEKKGFAKERSSSHHGGCATSRSRLGHAAAGLSIQRRCRARPSCSMCTQRTHNFATEKTVPGSHRPGVGVTHWFRGTGSSPFGPSA